MLEPIDKIDNKTAGRWVNDYHYLGGMPSLGGTTSFGFRDTHSDPLSAVIVVSLPNNPNGIARKYDLTAWPGNLEIARVVAHPDAPFNTASKALAALTRAAQHHLGVSWLYSYADTAQGHHGGIYQAVNAIYLGLNGPARDGYLLNGKRFHPRSVVSRYGTQRRFPGPNGEPTCMELAARNGDVLVPVKGMIAPKHTYLLITAQDRITTKAIRRHLADRTQPYPKRALVAA